MIQIHKTLEEFEIFADILDYDPATSLFFDIETTGFSPESSMVFLIGSIYYTEQGWQLAQYMAENADEEKELLSAFFSLAARYKTILHFNGATFDIPYLIQKADQYCLIHNLASVNSIDLYQRFRPLKKIFSLERMNQTSLELFLQYKREDQLTGKHMIDLFHKYTLSGESGLSSLLLLHNHDDLLGMTQLLRLSTYLTLSDRITNLSVKKADEEITSKNQQQLLEIEFQLSTSLPVPIERTIDEFYSLSIQNCYGKLLIPIYYDELYFFFPDYKNYYYLPLEDQAIHKSIGSFVDKEHRTNARPQNCYTRKASIFLPQPDHIFAPEFRRSYKDKQLYFEYSDTLLSESSRFMLYVKEILKKLI